MYSFSLSASGRRLPCGLRRVMFAALLLAGQSAAAQAGNSGSDHEPGTEPGAIAACDKPWFGHVDRILCERWETDAIKREKLKTDDFRHVEGIDPTPAEQCRVRFQKNPAKRRQCEQDWVDQSNREWDAFRCDPAYPEDEMDRLRWEIAEAYVYCKAHSTTLFGSECDDRNEEAMRGLCR